MKPMRFSLAWVMAVAMATCGTLHASGRMAYSADSFFAPNSTLIRETSKLDNIVCKAKSIRTESVIVLGYSDPDEREAQKLSEDRANSIRVWLANAGLDGQRIFAEGRGTRFSQEFSDPAKRRRVEVEVVGVGPFRKVDCTPSWQGALAEMRLPTALAYLKTRALAESMAPSWPVVVSIRANRMDLLHALLNSVTRKHWNKDDRDDILRAGVMSGDIGVMQRLQSFGLSPASASSVGLPILWEVCDKDLSLGHLPSISLMLDWLLKNGARPQTVDRYPSRSSALSCAAGSGNLALIDRLLAEGAEVNLPVGEAPILAGAHHPEVVRRLLQAKADPYVRSRFGNSTLFHEFKFQSAADVAWIAGLGLDINAESEGRYTPLNMAVRYASAEVLDAFVAHDAKLNTANPLVQDALNPKFPGLTWAIAKGAPIENPDRLFESVSWWGDGAVPEYHALFRRGFKVRESLLGGRRAIQRAIESLSPLLVSELLVQEAISEPADLSAALDWAQRAVVRHQVSVSTGYREPGWYADEDQLLNNAEALVERQRRKDRIIEILMAKQAR